MRSDDEPTMPIPIVPRRRGPWSAGRAALVVTVVVVLLGGVSVLAWPVVFRPPATAIGGGEVYRESTGDPGRDPFSGTVVVGNPPGTKSQTPIGAGGGGVSTIPGDVPALYGGSRNEHVCDRQKLITFLEENADKAAAWAGVLGIDTADIATYIGTLTPMQLRADTRVTNHGFVDGRATSLQSVLQAGTAVLADDHGRPRVKCGCGNPLLDPVATPITPVYTGDAWPDFDPRNLSAVTSAKVQVSRFVVDDLRTGDTFYRPRGTDGDQDQPTTPPAATTTTTPATPTPTPTPVVVTCPQGTHLSGAVCVANAPPRCPDGQVRDGDRCVPTQISCPDGSHPSDDGASCVRDGPHCSEGTHLDNGKCVDTGPVCSHDTHRDGDACVPDQIPCPTDTYHGGDGGDGGKTTCGGCPPRTHPVSDGTACAPDPTCPPDTHSLSGENTCAPNPCPSGTHPVGGSESTCTPNSTPITTPCRPGTRPVSDGTACAPDRPCPSDVHHIGAETTCASTPPPNGRGCPSETPRGRSATCPGEPMTATRSAAPPTTRPTAASPTAKPDVAPTTSRRTAAPSMATPDVAPPTARRTAAPPTARRTVTPPRARPTAVPPTAMRSVAPPAPGRTVTPPAAGGGSGYRTPCVLPDGRQGVINRSTGTCVPVG